LSEQPLAVAAGRRNRLNKLQYAFNGAKASDMLRP
jgi:hypothetical protein